MKPNRIALLVILFASLMAIERLWNGESINSFEYSVRASLSLIFMTLLGISYQLERLFGEEKS